MDYRERQEARRQLVEEVVTAASAKSPECRGNQVKANKIAWMALDSWEPRFEAMSESEIKQALTRSVKAKIRDRRDEFGFVLVITMGMLMTWVIQALVVSIIAALVQRWFRDKDSMRKVVQ